MLTKKKQKVRKVCSFFFQLILCTNRVNLTTLQSINKPQKTPLTRAMGISTFAAALEVWNSNNVLIAFLVAVIIVMACVIAPNTERGFFDDYQTDDVKSWQENSTPTTNL